MRLYYKSSVITQRKEILKKSSYSVCRKPFNNKKLVYIIEELLNWYTLKRIVLK